MADFIIQVQVHIDLVSKPLPQGTSNDNLYFMLTYSSFLVRPIRYIIGM